MAQARGGLTLHRTRVGTAQLQQAQPRKARHCTAYLGAPAILACSVEADGNLLACTARRNGAERGQHRFVGSRETNCAVVLRHSGHMARLTLSSGEPERGRPRPANAPCCHALVFRARLVRAALILVLAVALSCRLLLLLRASRTWLAAAPHMLKKVVCKNKWVEQIRWAHAHQAHRKHHTRRAACSARLAHSSSRHTLEQQALPLEHIFREVQLQHAVCRL